MTSLDNSLDETLEAQDMINMIKLTATPPETLKGNVFFAAAEAEESVDIVQEAQSEMLTTVVDVPEPIIAPVVEPELSEPEWNSTEEVVDTSVPEQITPPTISFKAGDFGDDNNVINVGLDLGRSETRIYDGEHLLSFPTLVGGPVATIRRSTTPTSDESLAQNLQVSFNGRDYSIGRYALEQPFLFPLNDDHIFTGDLNKALILGALGLLAKRRGLINPTFKICLGLPVYLNRRPDITEPALAQWLGTQEFNFCGEKTTLTIAQIDTIPQPVGAIYSALIAGHLEYNPEETIGVIDPGHLTTDWVVVRLPNELTQYSGHTTSFAGYRLVEGITHYLAEQMVPRVNHMAIIDALTTGVYEDNEGRSLTLPPALLNNLKEIMAQQIQLTVKQSWRDLRVNKMLLVGGFGRMLYPLLSKDSYFRELQLLPEARKVNVKGFYEYAIATPLKTGLVK
jgi:hypothetical protein